MKKQILLLLAFFAFAFNSNAQTISIIGDATPGLWDTDTNMTTSDNVTYTLSNVTLTGGGLKFRQDGAWTNNWGSGSFPSGTGTPGGANIPVTAGVYDVTFNLTTKAYSFTPAATGFPTISVFGTSNSNVDADMSTVDGINYSLDNYALGLGNLVFRQDHDNVNTWGAADFPSGTATSGGDAINVIPGTYNIRFNLNTGVYSFQYPSISVIGDALGGWGTDTDMFTSDGVNYSLTLTTFTTGELKFRQDHAWAYSWGSTSFPTGIATLNGSNINVIGGDAVLTFNRETGAYAFSSNYPVISLNSGGTDIDLTTYNGINYFINNYTFATDGGYKFRKEHANDFVWGSTAFPSGLSATYITNSIPVKKGSYNITFNVQTGVFAFNYLTISIIGDATPGGWGTDTNMTTTDGVTYKLNGVSLTRAELKFRQGNDWATSWGGNAFPTATGVSNGANIKVYTASVYNITFNRVTGKYTFVDTNLTGFYTISIIGDSTPGGWGADTPMTTTNGINYRINGVSLVTGELKFRMGNDWATSWGGNYPSGSNSIGGNNIPIPNNSVYNITLNISTGAYTITDVLETKIIPSQCGSTLFDLNTQLSAIAVSGATTYRFEITNTTTSVATVLNLSKPSFNLTQLATGSPSQTVAYNTVYAIKVGVNNGGFTYGPSCNVSTPASIRSTKVVNKQCGVTLTQLNETIYADQVYNANKFRFIVNGGSISNQEIDATLPLFNLTQLTGTISYNTSYTIRVKASKDGGATWPTAYGATCTLTTPATQPTSNIISPACGSTLASLGTSLYAQPVYGATHYRYEVNGGIFASRTFISTIVSPLGELRLTSLVGGAEYSTLYTVRVAVSFDNGLTYESYGRPCSFTTPSAPIARMTNSALSNVFEAKAFPNPFATNFRLSIESSSDDVIEMKVYDMIGRQLETKNATVSELSNQEIGSNYPSGIYNVLLKQGENVKSIRMIKR